MISCIISPACLAVGVADRNTIPDDKITASSFYSSSYYPYYGRLNENRGQGWLAKTRSDRTDYLQVDMAAVYFVCAVATQGANSFDEWTTSYKIHLSVNGITWNTYKEDNAEKVRPSIHQSSNQSVNQSSLHQFGSYLINTIINPAHRIILPK